MNAKEVYDDFIKQKKDRAEYIESFSKMSDYDAMEVNIKTTQSNSYFIEKILEVLVTIQK